MVTENNSFYPQPIFEGAEKRLTGDRSGAGAAANTFVEQCDRW